jgi:hypothetical protein
MGMIKAASVTPESPTAAIVVEEMANTVLLVGEWLALATATSKAAAAFN